MNNKWTINRTLLMALVILFLCPALLAQSAKGEAKGLQVEQATIEKGHVWRGQEVITVFRLHNPTERVIEISDIFSDCVCTEVEVESAVLNPGEGMELAVVVRTWEVAEEQGRIIRLLHLVYGDQEQFQLDLAIAFDLEERHGISPGLKREHLYRRSDKDLWAAWKISPFLGSKVIDLELPPELNGSLFDKDGAQWLRVQPNKHLKVGLYVYDIKVHLDDPEVSVLPLTLSWILAPDTRIQPAFIVFMGLAQVKPKVGIRPPKRTFKERIMVHRSSGKELKILKITTSNEALIRVVPTPADKARSRWILNVTVLDRFPLNKPVEEWIQIEIDDPDTPKVIIPIWNGEGMNRAKSGNIKGQNQPPGQDSITKRPNPFKK